MFKYMAAAAAALALTVSASAANALTTIAGSVSNVSANTGDGLIINSGLYNSFNFDLNVGENSGPIGLFTIWTDEEWVEWGEDTTPKNIAVSFNFLSPTGVSGDPIEGETRGFNFIVTGGKVVWDAPEIYTFGNGGKMKITLKDTRFNVGDSWSGVNEGKKYGAVVTGNFELLSEPTLSAVPEPATWAMMITGFGLAGTAIRRRRTTFAVAA